MTPEETRALDREIEVAERMEMRTQVARGHRPGQLIDSDEPMRDPPATTPTLSAPSEDYDGFWKHSEYLKCRRGDPMESDYRGLPPGYMEERS